MNLQAFLSATPKIFVILLYFYENLLDKKFRNNI